FILAACAPFNDGFKFSRPEYNEAQGLKEASETTFVVGDIEEVELPEGKVKARKITMQRGQKGPALPVWVNEAREIVQVDWGTKNYMKLHREKTDSLFKPAAPLLKQLEPDDKTKLVLTAAFHGFKLADMGEQWATADGLKNGHPHSAGV